MVRRIIDEYRQRLIYGLTPEEDKVMEIARATGKIGAI